ncbi:MAG: M1 family metallopeptidase [Chloroflexi bacterium]|nr:M1 family metallopeptidase [Chloroflexota bacterium]
MAFKDFHSYADIEQGKISHIDLKIAADFEVRVLNIEAKYQFDQPVTGSLFLDTSKLAIKRASAEGHELEWELDKEDSILGERLHLKGLQGVTEITLEFSTSPNAQALQWVPPVQTTGGQHAFLYSQCQAINARSLFPCQDTPSVRFTYNADFEVPEPLVGVMGAENMGMRELDNKRIYSFKMPQSIPSYLFALAAGNLVFREFGPRTGVYAEPQVIEGAVWEFAENEAKLIQAEELLGPYQWSRYDLLILPPSFPYGGMENPCLTFLTPIIILGDRSQTTLITHELAHAWTGNLVTNSTWEHFWLNEGWTTYAEGRITETLESVEAAKLRKAFFADQLMLTMQRVGMESNLTCLKTSLDGLNPDTVISYIPYYKGMFFIDKLEQAVGRESFDVFIQKYMQRFKFQSLTTEEFLTFLDEELPEAGEKVSIQEWVYEPGVPEGGFPVESELYAEAMTALQAFQDGDLPSQEQVSGWKYGQTAAFLQGLPEKMTIQECKQVDQLFDLETTRDAGLLYLFYPRCITSGYEHMLSRIEELLARIGRGAYINPIFRALASEAWSKPHARRIFEQVRERYHPLAVSSIDEILTEAGL